jgi:hypothetical protein
MAGCQYDVRFLKQSGRNGIADVSDMPNDFYCGVTRRPRDTPIWKLEAALKCRSCRTPRHSPRVHMIKLTQQREIAPYKWVHPDDDERR